MSKADEMIKRLGYKKSKEKYAEVYTKEYDLYVRQFAFNKEYKDILLDLEYLTMEELQAINEKVKELGWL